MSRQERENRGKPERALQLHEQGLSRGLIAERLSVKPSNVNGMIERAKMARAKAEGAAE